MAEGEDRLAQHRQHRGDHQGQGHAGVDAAGGDGVAEGVGEGDADGEPEQVDEGDHGAEGGEFAGGVRDRVGAEGGAGVDGGDGEVGFGVGDAEQIAHDDGENQRDWKTAAIADGDVPAVQLAADDERQPQPEEIDGKQFGTKGCQRLCELEIIS